MTIHVKNLRFRESFSRPYFPWDFLWIAVCISGDYSALSAALLIVELFSIVLDGSR